MDFASVSILITAVLSIASIILGVKYNLGKSKLAQLTQLLNLIIEAAKDDTVTEAEFQNIATAAKSLMGKLEA